MSEAGDPSDLGGGPPGLTPEEAAELVAEGALLVDVREPEEWTAGHAPEASFLPLALLDRELATLPLDRPIVCVCRVGGRSALAAAAIAVAGRDAWNLEGGMLAWAAAGLPVVDDSGMPGFVA